MRHQRVAVATLLLLTAACGASAPAQVASASVTAEPLPSEAPATTVPPHSHDLRLVEQLRQLPALAPIAVETVNRTKLLRIAVREIDLDTPAEVMRARGQLLMLLGVVPSGFNFRQSVETLLGQSLVGLYDPFTKRVAIAEDVSLEDARLTRFHELGHALVDQHFDLLSIVGYRPDAADRLQAYSSLAEGDATALMLDAVTLSDPAARQGLRDAFVEGMLEGPQLGSKMPRVLSRLLAAPYVDGLRFVEWLRQRGGWQEVNEAWRRLPATTEQILHPEKYLADERGDDVAIPPAPAFGCRLAYSDILGEATLRDLFTEWVTVPEASAAAGGWHGDRVAVYDCDQEPWAVLAIHTDTAADRAEAVAVFEAAWRQNRCGATADATLDVRSAAEGLRVTLGPGTLCHADSSSSSCSHCQGVPEAP